MSGARRNVARDETKSRSHRAGIQTGGGDLRRRKHRTFNIQHRTSNAAVRSPSLDGGRWLFDVGCYCDSSLAHRPVGAKQRRANLNVPEYKPAVEDRKSTRLNSSHANISYAV